MPESGTIIVKTLIGLPCNADAARLVSPYVAPRVGATGDAASTGVFEAGNAVHAITVRLPGSALARIDSIVKANDRPPATLTLRLQVIVASDSAVNDGSIGEIDAELRHLFEYAEYKSSSQNTVWVNDGAMFSTTMRGPNADQLIISGEVTGVRREGTKSVRLEVNLSHDAHVSNLFNGKVQTSTIHQSLAADRTHYTDRPDGGRRQRDAEWGDMRDHSHGAAGAGDEAMRLMQASGGNRGGQAL